MARRSWPIEVVVEADSWLCGSDSLGMDRGFNSATNQLEFGFNFASIFATVFAAIFATIALRSGRDRASIVMLVLRRSPVDRLETNPQRSHDRISSIAAQSRRDRVVIGLRSWSSSTMYLDRLIDLQVSEWSDRDLA